jgi:hypothetical protein
VLPVTPVADTAEAVATKAALARQASEAESAATKPLLLAAPADAENPQPRGRATFDRVREALKARIGGVRAHLADAAAGDHRATVAALTKLTDLVHEMFGPDRSDHSLRSALTALAAGRNDYARGALEAARASLSAGDAHLGPEESDAVATIERAEAAIGAGDRVTATRLIETALDLVE